MFQDCCTIGAECRYKHKAPVDVGMGNYKTTWQNVWKREGDDGYVRGIKGGLLDGPVMHDSMMGGGQMMGMMGGGCGPMDSGVGIGFSREEFMMIKRDNEMLRTEVMELRKKNEGLKATNQFLLEENANMRMKEQMGGGGAKAIQYDCSSPSGAFSNSGYSGGNTGYSGSNSGYSGGSSGFSSTNNAYSDGGSRGYGNGGYGGYSSGRGGSGGW